MGTSSQDISSLAEVGLGALSEAAAGSDAPLAFVALGPVPPEMDEEIPGLVVREGGHLIDSTRARARAAFPEMAAALSFTLAVQSMLSAIEHEAEQAEPGFGIAIGQGASIDSLAQVPALEDAVQVIGVARGGDVMLTEGAAKLAQGTLLPFTRLVDVRDGRYRLVTLKPGEVTVLFVGLHQCHRVWDENPEAAIDVLAEYDSTVRGTIEFHEGFVWTVSGDQWSAVFSRAEDALSAALAAQQGMATLGFRTGLSLHVRSALQTSVFDRPPYLPEGQLTADVADLLPAAEAGSVLVSGDTLQALRPTLASSVAIEPVKVKTRRFDRPKVASSLRFPSFHGGGSASGPVALETPPPPYSVAGRLSDYYRRQFTDDLRRHIEEIARLHEPLIVKNASARGRISCSVVKTAKYESWRPLIEDTYKQAVDWTTILTGGLSLIVAVILGWPVAHVFGIANSTLNVLVVTALSIIAILVIVYLLLEISVDLARPVERVSVLRHTAGLLGIPALAWFVARPVATLIAAAAVALGTWALTLIPAFVLLKAPRRLRTIAAWCLPLAAVLAAVALQGADSAVLAGPGFVRAGVRAGLLGSSVSYVLYLLIEGVQNAAHGVIERRKLRGFAEEEVIDSLVHSLAVSERSVEPSRPKILLEGRNDTKTELVESLEWLAAAIEKGLPGALKGRDPATTRWFQNRVREMAADVRGLKRHVLFPHPDSSEELKHDLRKMLVAAASGHWDLFGPDYSRTGDNAKMVQRDGLTTRLLTIVPSVVLAIMAAVILAVLEEAGMDVSPELRSAVLAAAAAIPPVANYVESSKESAQHGPSKGFSQKVEELKEARGTTPTADS